MLYFIEYILAGKGYFLYCLLLIIGALAFLGKIDKIEEEKALEVYKKKKEIQDKKNQALAESAKLRGENINTPQDRIKNINKINVEERVMPSESVNKNQLFEGSNLVVNNSPTENVKTEEVVNKTSDGFLVFK